LAGLGAPAPEVQHTGCGRNVGVGAWGEEGTNGEQQPLRNAKELEQLVAEVVTRILPLSMLLPYFPIYAGAQQGHLLERQTRRILA